MIVLSLLGGQNNLSFKNTTQLTFVQLERNWNSCMFVSHTSKYSTHQHCYRSFRFKKAPLPTTRCFLFRSKKLPTFYCPKKVEIHSKVAHPNSKTKERQESVHERMVLCILLFNCWKTAQVTKVTRMSPCVCTVGNWVR